MKKIIMATMVMALTIFLSTFGAYAMNTQVINLGDTTIEYPQHGISDPPDEYLSYWLQARGITNEDGTPVDVIKNQSQAELFYTADSEKTYELEYLGLAYASYHSPFGIFTYDGNPFEPFDSTKISYQAPLFVQNEAADGSKYTFTLAANTYFGFYLNSNKSGTMLTTMVAGNPLPAPDSNVQNISDYTLGFDHAIFFRTNNGYTFAFEDHVGGYDADWEDLVVKFNQTFEPEVGTPEPATFVLLGLGLIGVAVLRNKKKMAV